MSTNSAPLSHASDLPSDIRYLRRTLILTCAIPACYPTVKSDWRDLRRFASIDRDLVAEGASLVSQHNGKPVERYRKPPAQYHQILGGAFATTVACDACPKSYSTITLGDNTWEDDLAHHYATSLHQQGDYDSDWVSAVAEALGLPKVERGAHPS